MTLKHLIAIAFLSVSPLFAQAQDVKDNDNTTETGNKTDSVVVSSIVIPNAFSPNNDGINDRLCFNPENIVTFHILIYNRWGQVVFSSSDINDCWDGTFRNEPCLPGVYTYTCRITCHTGLQNEFKGDITLIR